MTRRSLAVLAALLVTVTLVGCGSDDDTTDASSSGTSAPAAAFPVDLTTGAGDVTITTRPTHIVSLSPSATETLFAIGAGDQVVAVDKNSNFPADVPKGDLDAYEPNVEAVLDQKPDLVVLSNDANDLVDSLQAVKVPVLLEEAPDDVDGVFAQVDQLGKATGHRAEATKLRSKMRTDIQTIVDGSDVEGVSYYYELDQSLYSQTSKTFLGRLLGRLGLENVADAADATTDYPQLSAEHVIQQDPDLILLADTKCCGQSAATVAARPGWGELHAVKGGNIVALDDDVASRWGPRIVTLLRQVATAAAKVARAR